VFKIAEYMLNTRLWIWHVMCIRTGRRQYDDDSTKLR